MPRGLLQADEKSPGRKMSKAILLTSLAALANFGHIYPICSRIGRVCRLAPNDFCSLAVLCSAFIMEPALQMLAKQAVLLPAVTGS